MTKRLKYNDGWSDAKRGAFAALSAEVEALRENNLGWLRANSPGGWIDALRADGPDAERYRWLRGNPESIPYRDERDFWCVPYLVSNAGGHGGGVGESRHKSLDAAIDAARAAQGGK